MTEGRPLTISGDLGSGKTTVANEVAHRLGIRRVSMGDVHRKMAEERGMTALQLNLHSERDQEIDKHVDRVQAEMADSGEQLIMDSRLGWHFFKEAFKIHLIVDPDVAAQRVLGRPSTQVESYGSIEDAKRDLHDRSESERQRFITKYNVDKTRLRNYSLICDTTDITPQEAAAQIVEIFESSDRDIEKASAPHLLLNPSRIYPTEKIQSLRGMWEEEGNLFVERVRDGEEFDPISVGYSNGYFFVIDGHRRLSAAIRAGQRIVKAYLCAEFEEQVIGGLSATEYFESSVHLSMVYDWEAAHNVTLPLPAHIPQPI